MGGLLREDGGRGRGHVGQFGGSHGGPNVSGHSLMGICSTPRRRVSISHSPCCANSTDILFQVATSGCVRTGSPPTRRGKTVSFCPAPKSGDIFANLARNDLPMRYCTADFASSYSVSPALACHPRRLWMCRTRVRILIYTRNGCAHYFISPAAYHRLARVMRVTPSELW